jgi:hypothetical protein
LYAVFSRNVRPAVEAEFGDAEQISQEACPKEASNGNGISLHA